MATVYVLCKHVYEDYRVVILGPNSTHIVDMPLMSTCCACNMFDDCLSLL